MKRLLWIVQDWREWTWPVARVAPSGPPHTTRGDVGWWMTTLEGSVTTPSSGMRPYHLRDQPLFHDPKVDVGSEQEDSLPGRWGAGRRGLVARGA